MSPFEEGFRNAIAGGRRSDNPYARGWSRVAALVMPGSLSADWDAGHQQGIEYRDSVGRVIDDLLVPRIPISVLDDIFDDISGDDNGR